MTLWEKETFVVLCVAWSLSTSFFCELSLGSMKMGLSMSGSSESSTAELTGRESLNTSISSSSTSSSMISGPPTDNCNDDK